MKLKDIRLKKGLTQEQAAKMLGISRRTYIKYENDELREKGLKYKFMCQTLEEYGFIDETHGLLTLEQIKSICAEVFEEYNVEYGYLFGSYAKGKAKENSDVDLLVSIPKNGLQFFGLVETLREKLNKKVDVLDEGQLNNNIELIKEILRDGIKIYG
jgi:predicted nucleotidyltransferase